MPAFFEPKSRYASQPTRTATDARGRSVTVVELLPAPAQTLLGYHLLRQGQRLDHLAQLYLGDPNGYWRIAEMNAVMLAEALTEAEEIAIPVKAR